MGKSKSDMKVLEEFWYGNLNPIERPFHRQRKFDEVFKLLKNNEEKLLETLNENEKELFTKYKACEDELVQITECETFKKGFKLGVRFKMEYFENYSNTPASKIDFEHQLQ